MIDGTCMIWGTKASYAAERGGRIVSSSRAGGSYWVSGSAGPMLKQLDEIERVRLTDWLTEQRRLGTSVPEITSFVLHSIGQRRPPSIDDRVLAFLRYLHRESELLGTVVKFYAEDNSKSASHFDELLAWTSSLKASELITLAEFCASEKWIEHRVVERSGASRNTIHEIMLRPPGYSRLSDADSSSSSVVQAFIAMWFDKSMDETYHEGIAKAVREAGYEPLRIDGKEHNNKIDDEIIAEIRRSRFVVADFTQGTSGARGGVYYEAGFAHGLGIPVIFTCQKASIESAHFDTRQYNHIVWENHEQLRKQLAQRISATMGDGPLKAS